MQVMAALSRDDTCMRQRFLAFHRTSAHYSKGRACTRFAHAALQLIDVARESHRSIIGATHKR
jgi:hypothetical protein